EFNDAWLGICKRAGFSPQIVQETAEMETALALVAAGMGVGLFPEGLARQHRRFVAVKSLTREKVRSEIGLAVLRDSAKLLTRNFLAVAKATAKR
ncbi:MAG: transcriptional regulator, LysR family, partial [Bryobacterales bacterium]|nr:transcriptional regulator, LysR family [Bryobacterales bacterium]